MKLFVIISFTLLLIVACRYNNNLASQNKTDSLQQKTVSSQEEQSEHSPGIIEVAPAQLAAIDSVVNAIDGDKFLYKKADSAVTNKNIGQHLKYEVMYQSKKGKPAKIISMNVNASSKVARILTI